MKKITVAITGHRDIVVTKQLIEDIKKLFIELALNYEEVTLLSPLADGADRLVADIYLELFNQNSNLIVPMPFDQERYMQDFDAKSKEEFLEYLKVANSVFEVKNTHGSHYKSVGIYVADNSDTLLALWDGTFNHKSGGTGEIVAYAQNEGKRVVHFLCERN